jgi:hypothetical protein
VATIGTEELGRYAGVGLTLDQVIEEELRKAGCAGVSAGPVEAREDVVLWEGNQVVALVRIGPEGRPVATRFDRPLADPSARGRQTPLSDLEVLRRFAAEVRQLVVDLDDVAPPEPARGGVSAALAGPLHPRKRRRRRSAVSRRPSPRRKPGWGRC